MHRKKGWIRRLVYIATPVSAAALVLYVTWFIHSCPADYLWDRLGSNWNGPRTNLVTEAGNALFIVILIAAVAGVAASTVLLVVDIVKSVRIRRVSVWNLCLDAYPVIGIVILYFYIIMCWST